MAIYDNLPYTNFHELNADWLLKTVKDVIDKTDEIDTAVEDSKNYALESKGHADDAKGYADSAHEDKTLTAADVIATQGLYDDFFARSTSMFDQITENTNDIRVNSGRIDNIVALQEGSTTGDAELQDIRVWWNGDTSATAGDAVRGQTSYLNELTTDLVNSRKFHGVKQTVTKVAKCMNTSGNLVDLTPYGLQSYHSTVSVNPNEFYNVKTSGSIYYPPFMFFDSNNVLIGSYYTISGDTRPGNINIDYNVKVPLNAVSMVINTLYNYIELRSLTMKNAGLSVMPVMNYIAFGDSVCRGNHPDAIKSQYAWPEMFGDIHNLNTVNRAVGGQAFLNTRYCPTTALQTIKNTDISAANLITLSFGLNDAGSTVTIGDVTDTGTTTVCGMLYNCISYIMTTKPKCQLIVTGTTKQNGAFGTRLKEINDKMEIICQNYGIAFVNTYDCPINQFNGVTGGPLTTDGTHFNDDGYLMLSGYMCGKLSALFGLM